MGFFDLNIPYQESDRHAIDKPSLKGRRLKLTLKAMELGYTGIAYNRTLRGVMSESDRCATPFFPLSKLIPSSSSFFASVKFHRELLNVAVSSPFRQYTRLTVVVDSPSQASTLNAGNPILKSYDIVAASPMNQNAFDQACQTSQVDMIAIDFSDKLPFRLKQPMVKAAIKRGVYFEITYSGLIADVQSRRQMMSNCKLLVDWTRGKNLILCSAAPSATELRGPQDVANLFSLLGLRMERAKAAISKNCRSLLAKALRKKHFYKEAVKVEHVNPAKSIFDDLLKWDPISSGEGDLLLDDMEKSFASSKTVKENVKTINFTSDMNGLPAHGLQIKDLICEMDAAVKIPEERGGHKPLQEDQSNMPENQSSLSNLSKDQGGVVLLPEGQMSSSAGKNIHPLSGSQVSEVSLDNVPRRLIADLPLPGHGQASLDDAKIGYQISDFEDFVPLSLPTCDGKSASAEDTIPNSNEQLKFSNGLATNHSDDMEANLVTSETEVQDMLLPVITKTDTVITDNHVNLEVSKPLALSKSTSSAFPLESTLENQFDMDVCAHEDYAVDKVPDKIDIENKQGQPLSSSDASSEEVNVEGQYNKMTNSSVKLGDGMPNEEFINLAGDLSEPAKDDVMGEQRQMDSVTNYQSLGKSQAAGRERRKRNLPHQHFLFPFKHFLKPRPSKRKSRK